MKRFVFIIGIIFYSASSFAGPNLTYGSNAISLGIPVSKAPGVDEVFQSKDKGVVLNKFYHIGGYEAPIAQSDVRLLWDENALYLYYQWLI